MTKVSLRIGVVGAGVVGSTVIDYFVDAGYAVSVLDPLKGLESPDAVNETDIVFICVPTPHLPGIGFDLRAVEESVEMISGNKTIVIKSTVLPGTTDTLQRRHPRHTLLFNPEFLRENRAGADFVEPDRQIVGYCDGGRRAAERLLELLPRAPYEALVPAAVAELTKYATNSFLAIKVIFANQIYDLCGALGIDYEEVQAGIAADQRVGPSHLDVHSDGYRGYGGKCLPKDTRSLIDLATSLGVDLSLLRAASSANEELRKPSCLQAPLLPSEAGPGNQIGWRDSERRVA